MNTVLLVIVIMMPGQSPLFYVEPMASHEECMAEHLRFVQNPTHQLKLRGGQLQIGCTLSFVPSEEH